MMDLWMHTPRHGRRAIPEANNSGEQEEDDATLRDTDEDALIAWHFAETGMESETGTDAADTDMGKSKNKMHMNRSDGVGLNLALSSLSPYRLQHVAAPVAGLALATSPTLALRQLADLTMREADLDTDADTGTDFHADMPPSDTLPRQRSDTPTRVDAAACAAEDHKDVYRGGASAQSASDSLAPFHPAFRADVSRLLANKDGSPTTSSGHFRSDDGIQHTRSMARFAKEQQLSIQEFVNLERETMLQMVDSHLATESSLHEIIAALQAENAAIKAKSAQKLASKTEQHNGIWMALTTDIVRLNQENARLKEENDNLSESLENLEQKLALKKEATDENANQKSPELHENENDTQLLLQKVTELESLVGTLTEEKESLKQALKDSTSGHSNALYTVPAFDSTTFEISQEAQLQSLTNQNARLQATVHRLEREVSETRTLLCECQDQNARYAEQVNEGSVFMELQAAQDILTQEVLELQDALKSEKERYGKLCDSGAAMKVYADTVSKELDRARADLDSTVDILDEERAEHNSLKQEHAHLKKEYQVLEGNISRMKLSFNQAGEEAHDEEVAARRVTAREIHILQLEREEMNDSLTHLNKRLKEQLERVDLKDREVEYLRQQLTEREAQVCLMEETVDKNLKMEKRADQLEFEIHGLKERLEHMKLRGDVLARENEGLVAQMAVFKASSRD
ncbi:hypothetical protein HDU77_005321 [Chytriomyces hyalinus]|nr:hypothetical protein HDU77_005321 [Chytriomyces hyalinus]